MNEAGVSMGARLADVADEWRGITSTHVVPDEGQYAAVRAEAIRIKAAGRWVSGPADLLTILRRHRDELFHSRVLAWLLSPTGRHGFGDRFLQALMHEVWPGERLFDGGPIRIEIERTRSGTNPTGDVLEARADLVIELESVVIVIENKLDAGEQSAQCERLYWAWADDSIEVRWLYLSPTGRLPSTTSSTEAQLGWSTASYAQVHRALSSVLDSASAPLDIGRSTAHQYLATLAASIKH